MICHSTCKDSLSLMLVPPLGMSLSCIYANSLLTGPNSTFYTKFFFLLQTEVYVTCFKISPLLLFVFQMLILPFIVTCIFRKQQLTLTENIFLPVLELIHLSGLSSLTLTHSLCTRYLVWAPFYGWRNWRSQRWNYLAKLHNQIVADPVFKHGHGDTHRQPCA